MNKIIKQTHIELSAGGTNIVSNKNCPLSGKDIIELKLLFPVSDDVETPCCMADAFVDHAYDIQCSHYFGYINSDEGEFFNCDLLNLKNITNDNNH